MYGDNVSLNMSCHVNADVNGTIILGNDSIYGPSCLFRASNHQFGSRVFPKYLPHDHGSIVIGEGVWSGAYVVFLKEHRRTYSVVGASAVVSKSFSERSVLVGIPLL